MSLLAPGVVLAFVVLTLSAGAQASTISFDVDVMTIDGTAAGDDIYVIHKRDYCLTRPSPCVGLLLTGPGDSLTSYPADRCSQQFGIVECAVPAKVVANLHAGDDHFALGVLDVPAKIHGGGGADRVDGGPNNDEILGEAGDDSLAGYIGDDRIDGGEGDDRIVADDTISTSGDVYAGGLGTDYVTYGPRRDALTVSLDDLANDGGADEHDDVRSDVEGVYGGWGADSLTGNGAANDLDGGSDGNDTLIGAGGDDRLFGRFGDDDLVGGEGADDLVGGQGDDELDGGPGVDDFEGDEVVPGCRSDSEALCPSGADHIMARDGLAEHVSCGPDVDTAVVDDIDRVADSPDIKSQCEQVDRGAVTGPPAGDGGATNPGGSVPAATGGQPAGASGGPADLAVRPAGLQRVAPRVSALSVDSLRRGRSTKVRYTLSHPASVTFTLKRHVRRGGRVRFVTVPGSFRHAGRTGRNLVSFSGRLRGRRLAAGRYRLVAIARDSANNASSPVRASLRVLR